MTDALQVYELIYVSSIAPDAAPNTVPDISRGARLANSLSKISGLLVFDGQRFCHQIEGTMKSVVDLFERISIDKRHADVRLLYQGKIDARRFRRFNVGYPQGDAGETLAELGELDGQAAMLAFSALASSVHTA